MKKSFHHRAVRWIGAVVVSVTAVLLVAPAASAEEQAPDDSIWGVQPVGEQPLPIQPNDSIWG